MKKTNFVQKLFVLLVFLFSIGESFAWKPIMIGHRGCRDEVENTEKAFLAAINTYGFQGLECDVKVTSDKKYICWHDDDLSRVGHTNTIAGSSLATLQGLTLKQTRHSTTYTGKICTVKRYLEICKQYNVVPIVELKWATGINNNDMSNFAGLYQVFEEVGMVDKIIILTSMQKSLTHIRTNYPKLKCQFLCYDMTDARTTFCQSNGIHYSVQNGGDGLNAANIAKLQSQGTEVAVYTLNSLALYKEYAAMGVNYITSDGWAGMTVAGLPDMTVANTNDKLYVDELFNFSEADGNLPTGFPDKAGSHVNAQQAAYINGNYYTADATSDKVITISKYGNITVPTTTVSNLQIGTCRDDAGNLIVNTSASASAPTQITVYPGGDLSKTPKVINFTLNNTGEDHLPTASGDILNGTGYVYFFPNGQKFVEVVKIVNGAHAGTTSHAVSLTGTTAGYVIPIDNNPKHFIYQVRGDGYYLFNNTDQGAYLATSASTTAPARNSSVGGAFFQLDVNGTPHDMFLHTSGGNYKGGWTIRDMSSSNQDLYTHAELGTGGYDKNGSCGSFFQWNRISTKTVDVYEYCLGHGIAGWRISSVPLITKGFRLQTYDPATSKWDNTEAVVGGSVKVEYNDKQILTINDHQRDTIDYLWKDSTIYLTATPLEGYEFVGWFNNGTDYFGSPQSKKTTYKLTSNAAAQFTITARFRKVYAQTITVEGGTGASVTIAYNNKEQADTVTNTNTYNAYVNSTITLKVTNDTINTFEGWYEDSVKLSTDTVYTYKPTKATSITAKFAPQITQKYRVQTYEVDSWATGIDGGTITVNYNNGKTTIVAYEPTSTSLYINEGSSVSVVANPNADYKFIGWYSNGLVSSEDTYTYTANTADQLLTARFRKLYAQTISVENAEGGSVEIAYKDGKDTTAIITNTGSYKAFVNTPVTLTATADTDYVFDGWYENATLITSENPYAYTAAEGNRNIVAKFKKTSTPTYLENNTSSSEIYKLFQNGKLYIYKQGKKYTVMGQEL